MRRTLAATSILLISLLGIAALAQQGPSPIGSRGSKVTGTSPIVVTGSVVSCPTCGTGSGNASTSNPLSQFAATTSAQLAGVLSDETGTGAAVFANTPTLVTPVLGAATGTSLSLSGNGAASTPVSTWSGTPNTGSATTSYPMIFANCSGSTVSGGLSTGGTIFGINTCTGFAGNLLGLYNNGTLELTVSSAGAVLANGRVNSAATSGVGPSGRSALYSAADGRATLNNNANGANGFSRLSFGTEAATNPALCFLANILSDLRRSRHRHRRQQHEFQRDGE